MGLGVVMTDLDRRSFLRAGAVAAGAAAFGGPFQGYLAGPVAAQAADFRRLRAIPDLRDGVVRLWLPEGFSYRSFDDNEAGATTTSGVTLPGRHDGMAAFRGPSGHSILVRNHEVNGPVPAFGASERTPYDAMTGGGTTTVEVTKDGHVVESYVSLNGTQMNCSGGPMPWASWVTCEETVNGPDVGPDFTGAPNVALTKPHGFVYEVPSREPAPANSPIRKAGRFAHESVAFDPLTNALYLTEDNFGFPSGFYKYEPPNDCMKDRRIEDGGRLSMLAVKGSPNANLAASQPAGAKYQVEWVEIDDPDPEFPFTPGQTAPTTNDQALTYVGNQGRAQGAAYFSRLEGSAYDRGIVYFTSTQGGGPAETSLGPIADGFGNGTGQIWAYHTRSRRLELAFESPSNQVLDFPDNVTTSRRGTLVVCEDNVADNFIRGLSRNGKLFDIALNRLRSSLPGNADRSNDEFAGSTFSVDGETLFVNIQASRGMSFAIRGNWARIGV
jgi:secreted PhoX family phosphatase